MLLYRLVLSLAVPALLVMALLRLVSGREGLGDIAERLGGGTKGKGRALWVHGASNGELTSIRPFLDHVRLEQPDIGFLITANSVTGRDLVASWDMPGVTARLAPVDLRWCLRRFVGAHDPFGLLTVESELWPNRLSLLRQRRVPVALVGARLSERSARRWRLLSKMARDLLSGLRLVSPQSTIDGERLGALGVRPEAMRLPLMLKAMVRLPEPNPDLLADFEGRFERWSTLLAASTHAGEEALVIEAFRRARKHRPGLRLILAPRHPPRADEVSALLTEASLVHGRRSKGDLPGPQDPVYLADTLGEMRLWYRLAGLCFVGGSLVEKGGHTPYEPAAFGCALLHGPHVSNFVEAYDQLRSQAAVREVTDAATLSAALSDLAPDAAQALGQASAQALGATQVSDRARTLASELKATLLDP